MAKLCSRCGRWVKVVSFMDKLKICKTCYSRMKNDERRNDNLPENIAQLKHIIRNRGVMIKRRDNDIIKLTADLKILQNRYSLLEQKLKIKRYRVGFNE